MKEIIAIKGLEVICKDDKLKCIIGDITGDSYYLERKNEPEGYNSWSGRSAYINDIEGINGELIFHPNFIGSKNIESHTFILIEPNCEVHNKMDDVFLQMRKVNKQALAFAESIGGVAFYRKGELAGGIKAIKFEDKKPPKGWKKYGKSEGAYCPGKNPDNYTKQMELLPTIEKSVMNNIYGFPTCQLVGNNIYFSPGIETLGSNFILEVDKGCIIAIKDGMRIISKSEYYALKGE